jgi:hypothetical protein
VNLRPETEVETEFVRFDRLRVVRVLERIAVDLDNLSLLPNDAHPDKESNPQDPQARHRHELAEPSREPKKQSHQEQRWGYRHSKNQALPMAVSPTKVRKVPQDFCQLPGRKGFSAIPELPRRDPF